MTFSRQCKECNKGISSLHFKSLFCNNECYKLSARKVKSAEIFAKNPQAIQCKCCKLYVDKGLIKHLNLLHNLSVEEYKDKYGQDAQIVSASTSKLLSDNNKGEKNAWFNHGGKMSKFSKNHASYYGLSDEEKAKKISEFVSTIELVAENMPNRIEYYLAKGLSEEEAKLALSKHQTTFSKEICIEKYGEEAGLKRWQDRQEKWQDNLNSKSLEEQERINHAKMAGNSGSFSKISKELFLNIHVENARWGSKTDIGNGEKLIKGKDKNYMLDFTLNNKCIEFNGTYWHAKPGKFSAEKVIGKIGHFVRTAQEIWDLDAIKQQAIIDSGYELLVIWEDDFRKDKEGTIEKCLNFLK